MSSVELVHINSACKLMLRAMIRTFWIRNLVKMTLISFKKNCIYASAFFKSHISRIGFFFCNGTVNVISAVSYIHCNTKFYCFYFWNSCILNTGKYIATNNNRFWPQSVISGILETLASTSRQKPVYCYSKVEYFLNSVNIKKIYL